MANFSEEEFNPCWEAFEASGLKPAMLLATAHNVNHILNAVSVFKKDFKKMPNPQEFLSIITYLGSMDTTPPGVLEYHSNKANAPMIAAATVAAVTAVINNDAMPHATDPQLAWLTTPEAIEAASADVIRRYCTEIAFHESSKDASGKTLYERFNERSAWIKKFVPKQPKAEKVEVKEPTEQEKKSKDIQDRLAKVHSYIGTLSVGGEYHSDKSIRLRDKLTDLVREIIQRRGSIEDVERGVDKFERNFDSPIR